MKKSKNLMIVLYVFCLLSIAYTCYMIFMAYSTFSAYYASTPNAGFQDMFQFILGNSYVPMVSTVILYGMAKFVEIFKDHLSDNVIVEPIEVNEETEHHVEDSVEKDESETK